MGRRKQQEGVQCDNRPTSNSFETTKLGDGGKYLISADPFVLPPGCTNQMSSARPCAPDADSPSTASGEADDEGVEVLIKSIDRARKRQLSPKTCRGDEAVDRLLAQELTASPLLKKSKHLRIPTLSLPTANMALTKEDLYKCIDVKVTKRFDSLESGQNMLEETVKKLCSGVKENTEKIEAQAEMVRNNQRDIASLKEALAKGPRAVPSPAANATYAGAVANTTPGTATSTLATTEDTNQFHRARRSVRLWPVHGTTREELWKNAGEFMYHKLALLDIYESMIDVVCRPDAPSSHLAKFEVVLTFKDKEILDRVLVASPRLAGCVDDAGRPTAGIRLEIPRRLKSAFSVLYKYGNQLRRRHGTELKKHIRFDEANLSIFMKVKLPGDDTWSEVSLDLALRSMKQKRAMTDDELERRLDITGPQMLRPRPRAASSAEAMSVDAPNSGRPTWTGRGSGSVSSQ